VTERILSENPHAVIRYGELSFKLPFAADQIQEMRKEGVV